MIISQDDYFDFKENNPFSLFPRHGIDVTDDSSASNGSVCVFFNGLMG